MCTSSVCSHQCLLCFANEQQILSLICVSVAHHLEMYLQLNHIKIISHNLLQNPPTHSSTYLKCLTSSHEWHTVGCVCACTSIGYNVCVCLFLWANTWSPWRLSKYCMCWTFGVACKCLYTCLLCLAVGAHWPVSGCVSQWPITKPPITPVCVSLKNCCVLHSHSKMQIWRVKMLLSFTALIISSLQWLIKFLSTSLKALKNYLTVELLQSVTQEKKMDI